MDRSKIQSYRDLEVWRKAIDLADTAYDAVAQFPKDEIYGLTSQIKRSAVSIPSNIAEGSARAGTAELIHFLSIARGSLAELETQLILAHRRKYLTQTTLDALLQLAADVNRMLVRLQQSLKAKS